MFIPLLSSILGSIAGVSDKLNLNLHKTSGRTYAALLFIAMSVVVVPFMIFSPTKNMVTAHSVFVILMIIVGSTLQNILFYTGLAHKKLSYLEPIINIESIVVILIAFAVFPSERSWVVLVLGVISSLALIYSHVEKNNLKQYRLVVDKYTAIVFLSILVAGFVHVGYKIALQYYSPLTLFSLRVIGVASLLSIFVKPRLTQMTKKQYGLLFVSAILYSAAGVLRNISITQIGISQTVLILMVSPVIAYMCSSIFLKEKLNSNRVIASVIIVSCVILVSILQIKG